MSEAKIGKYLHQHAERFRRLGLALPRNHSAPLNRRQLFACGFYSAGYTLVLPTLGQLLLDAPARAEELSCKLGSEILGVPVWQVHFSGGRRLWGDGLALGLHSHGKPAEFRSASGSFNTNDFFNYGLSPTNHPSLPGKEYVTLGEHPMPPISYIYQSALTVLGDQLRELDKDLAILSLAARAPDDSPATLQNILPSAITLRGKADFNLISNTLGSGQSGLGNLPIVGLTERATVLSGSDIAQLMNTGLGDLKPELRQQFMGQLHELVKERVSEQEARTLLGCSNKAARDKILQFATELDPFKNAKAKTAEKNGVADIFDANNAGDRNLGTMAYMLANNLSLVGGLGLGGFDYHDQTSGGYMTDYRAFTSIWKIVRYFHSNAKPLIVFATSDGSTYSNDALDPRAITIAGETVTEDLCASTGDRDRNAGAMFMFLSPKGKGRLPLDFHQVGFGLPRGAVSRDNNPIGYDHGN